MSGTPERPEEVGHEERDVEAGRELDALVAEKVMGWPAVRVTDRGVPGYEPGDVLPHVPRYSTDIAAAWEVVEKLAATHTVSIDYDEEGDWSAIFCDAKGDGIWCGVKKSAPLAICRAALKACE